MFFVFEGMAQSSGDCKFDIDKANAQGKPMKKIKTRLTGLDNFYFIIERNDTAYTLTLNIWLSGTMRGSIEKQSAATFLLSGGEELVLYNPEIAKPIPHYGDQAWTEYSPSYPISADALENLITVKPLNVKLKAGTEDVYREFNQKDKEKIRDIIRCITK